MEAVNQKILLVDDDPTFVRLYSAVFKAQNIDFSIAANGAEAIQKAVAEKPSLILLDIMLPDLNGFDVLKKLKQDEQTSNITVWVITNLAEQLNMETAKSLGAKDYLVKASYTPNQVVEKIKTFFQDSRNKPLQV
jgi:CheY-like chemotaxis protein